MSLIVLRTQNTHALNAERGCPSVSCRAAFLRPRLEQQAFEMLLGALLLKMGFRERRRVLVMNLDVKCALNVIVMKLDVSCANEDQHSCAFIARVVHAVEHLPYASCRNQHLLSGPESGERRELLTIRRLKSLQSNKWQ